MNEIAKKLLLPLKVVACLLIALTVALAMNVSNASAQPVICDRSANPTCIVELDADDCQYIPLRGFNLEEVKAYFSGDAVIQIYPPPTVKYEMRVRQTQVSGELEPTVTASYDFNPPAPGPGRICNVGGGRNLPFTVMWRNVSERE